MVRKYRMSALIAAAGVMLASAAVAQQVDASLEDARPTKPNPTNPAPRVGAQPPFTAEYESRLTVREDRTATEIATKRIKILTPGAAQTLSQQPLPFIEGTQTLEILEAFTEKPDGRRILVDPANIITGGAASAQTATFLQDLKVKTIIFADVSVGDTLVLTSKLNTLQDVFPGQFTYFDLYPRTLPLSSVRVTIESPPSLDLAVKATGNANAGPVELIDGVRRQTITIVPEPYGVEEAGAVSPFDREPALVVSTFHSYDELGMAYGKAAFPKARVTPEIAALADEITRGVDGRLAQAVAIDAWMKKNIRYVEVMLSAGRVVPHDPEAVLRNKFGDCKDKATLMTALLAAKGIASEAALINLGNAYSLADPPTMATLNHVILYLPEFDVYDDPTAASAAFGVLAAEAYDKPVVRVSATEAKLARTPAMNPAAHVAHVSTTIDIADDGTVTGRTTQSDTGILGVSLRFAAGFVQQIGDEAMAQRTLKTFNTPGTGHIDLGNSSETVDPVRITGSFALSDRFKAPTPGHAAILPVGMPLLVRPGNYLLGARLAGRQDAFVCFAGTQIEDIDETFGPALPLPSAWLPVRIDNPMFTYSSTFKLENRTLRIHREFVSRAPGQTCAAETEAKIAADLDKVRADLYRGSTFPAISDQPREVVAGQRRQLDFLDALKPDCSSMGLTVSVVEPPRHGAISIDKARGASNFPPNNPRFECNKRQNEGVRLVYEPAPGFTGADFVTVDQIYPGGAPVRRRYSLSVGPDREAIAAPADPQTAPPPPAALLSNPPRSPAIDEVSRVAVADQPLRVAFLYDLNPDCSLIGVPTVRILEPPKSGQVTVEKGAGFPAFPAKNLRSKCNADRTDGAVMTYVPNSGYKGTDSVVADIIYPDGSAKKRRYAIDVR